MIRIVCLILVVLFVPACQQSATQADVSITEQHTDSETGTTITVNVPSNEIGIAERVMVIDTVTWTDGEQREFADRDWVETEWTLIETTTDPMRIDGEQFSITRRSLIEPFLPGEYTIPPAAAVIGDSDTEIATQAIKISVLGVLTDEGLGDLNAIADYTVSAEEELAEPSWMWIALAGGAGLLAIAVIFALRSQGRDPSRSIFDELASIRDDKDEDEAGFERLGRVLDKLDPRLQQTSEFTEMISMCNQARFAPAEERTVRMPPYRVAGHALELLGHDGHHTTLEGES